MAISTPRHMSVIQTEKGGSTKVQCDPCGKRNRRGAAATFSSKASADLNSWIERHIKHGSKS